MIDFRRALEQFNVQAFVARHGGYKESLGVRSHEYLLPCVWCGSSRLRWNHPTKKAWQCWGCNRTGSTMDLIMAYERVTFPRAHEIVMEGYNGGDANLELTQLPVLRGKLEAYPAIPWPAGVDVLQPVDVHVPCWRYIMGRGVDAAMATQWRLGFGRFGRVKDYVIFPVFMDGALVYWQGRAIWDPPKFLDAEQQKRWVKETHYIKSINPVATNALATAGDVLLNYDRARNEPHVVIVEGPFDACKVGPHAVALLGKAATDAKIARLLRMKAQRYTVYLDRGDREYALARILAEKLNTYVPTYIAVPPEGRDPGKLSPEENGRVISQAVRFEQRALLGVRL